MFFFFGGFYLFRFLDFSTESCILLSPPCACSFSFFDMDWLINKLLLLSLNQHTPSLLGFRRELPSCQEQDKQSQGFFFELLEGSRCVRADRASFDSSRLLQGTVNWLSIAVFWGLSSSRLRFVFCSCEALGDTEFEICIGNSCLGFVVLGCLHHLGA